MLSLDWTLDKAIYGWFAIKIMLRIIWFTMPHDSILIANDPYNWPWVNTGLDKYNPIYGIVCS